jgi:hypothetical protein
MLEWIKSWFKKPVPKEVERAIGDVELVGGSGGGGVFARGGRGGSYGQPGEPGEFKTNIKPKDV